ncbi:unnamed protein product [Porites lobata]|uniref:Uncharacterized protein n=1 Tax=Porites lobata TaxID=104759 RepID=A0ABN8N3R9_9CNID|nr:unnamed protein product [Porites lobata]
MSLISGHRSDHAPTSTLDHRQTRPPDQISPQTTIHDCSSSNQHSTPNLVNGTEAFCSGLCNSRRCFQPAVVAGPLTLGQVTPATRSEVGKLMIEVSERKATWKSIFGYYIESDWNDPPG